MTGEPYLLLPHRIRRVILCTGQMYYRLRCAFAHSPPAAVPARARAWIGMIRAGNKHSLWDICSNARRAAKVRDIVMVRLEQLAPFPHDLVMKVCTACGIPMALCHALQFTCAEAAW